MPTKMLINLRDIISTTVETKNVLLTSRHNKINYLKKKTFSKHKRFGNKLIRSVNKNLELDDEFKKMAVLLNTTENAPNELFSQNTIEIATQYTSNSNEVV